MVQFGNHLEAQIYPPWAASYLDYMQLKGRIKDILEVKDNAEAASVLDARKHIFQGTFDGEVVKILKFYGDKKRELLSRLDELQSDIDALPTQVLNNEELSQSDRVQRINDLNTRLQDVARQITRLLEFVSLNMRGVRKILKKFAKNVDPTPPAPGFVALEIQHPHDPNWKLLQGTYLASSVQKDLDDMIEHREPAEAVHRIRVMHDALYNFKHDLLGADAPGVPVATYERMDTMLRDLSQAQIEADVNTNVVHAVNWAAAQAGIFTKPPPEQEAVATIAGLVLNCANSALYMANYNLVVPSIRSFLTHIGASVSLAGLLIGCCDLTSMPSTIGYSYWTNTTFKWPLLFSAASCLAGNVAYVAAYDTQSVSLLYAARLLTGLGAARAVSRRYIADFVSKRERTKASAAFVGSSAMGMALGPLLARLFQHFPTLHFGPLTFNYITMGAYTMAFIWLIYVVAIFVYFEDPRIQRARNARRSVPARAPELSAPLLTADASDAEAPMTNGIGAGKEERKLTKSQSFARALGPTMVCVYALLVLKTAQQSFVDSLPLITEGLYGWTDGTNGVYLAALGFSMIPVTIAMGAIASRVNDRVLTVFSMTLTLIGCLQIMNGGYPRWNYFLGGVGIYMGTIIMEGAAMSLESKVLHPSFKEGTFNAGLMSTEAGTLGRFTGNALLTFAGNLAGLDTRTQLTKFARILFGMTAALVVSNIVWFLPYYKRMAELGG